MEELFESNTDFLSLCLFHRIEPSAEVEREGSLSHISFELIERIILLPEVRMMLDGVPGGLRIRKYHKKIFTVNYHLICNTSVFVNEQ